VKIGNTGKSAVFFRKLTWRFPSGFCRKPAVFYQKLVNGTMNATIHVKNDSMNAMIHIKDDSMNATKTNSNQTTLCCSALL
jgi:hypothetical protein